MKVHVEIKKRHAFLIFGAILILAGVIGVVAFGTYDPAVFGHSIGEIDWSEQIPAALKINQGDNNDVWIQGGPAGSSGNDRNLALLGQKSGDLLRINYNEEYTGGTRIDGDVRVTGDIRVDGEVTGGGFDSCRIRVASRSHGGQYGGQFSDASCNSGETMVSGGGICGGNAKWMQATWPLDADTWRIACHFDSTPDTRAYVICCGG